MGNIASFFREEMPPHTCSKAIDPSQVHPHMTCYGCKFIARKRFEREAEIRTKAWLFPDQVKLETYGLKEDPDWIEKALRPSPEEVKLKEQAIKEMVAIHCATHSIFGSKKTRACPGPGDVEMREIQRALAVKLNNLEPQAHLSFEPPRPTIRKSKKKKNRTKAAMVKVPEGTFVVGDDDEVDGKNGKIVKNPSSTSIQVKKNSEIENNENRNANNHSQNKVQVPAAKSKVVPSGSKQKAMKRKTVAFEIGTKKDEVEGETMAVALISDKATDSGNKAGASESKNAKVKNIGRKSRFVEVGL